MSSPGSRNSNSDCALDKDKDKEDHIPTRLFTELAMPPSRDTMEKPGANELEAGGSAYKVDLGAVDRTMTDKERHETRLMLWKLDTRYVCILCLPCSTCGFVDTGDIYNINSILPILALLFLCSFLDRTNVGNAKLYNLENDLGMVGNQYSIGLAVFYATYIAR